MNSEKWSSRKAFGSWALLGFLFCFSFVELSAHQILSLHLLFIYFWCWTCLLAPIETFWDAQIIDSSQYDPVDMYICVVCLIGSYWRERISIFHSILLVFPPWTKHSRCSDIPEKSNNKGKRDERNPFKERAKKLGAIIKNNKTCKGYDQNL